jgi:hypothetical protein
VILFSHFYTLFVEHPATNSADVVSSIKSSFSFFFQQHQRIVCVCVCVFGWVFVCLFIRALKEALTLLAAAARHKIRLYFCLLCGPSGDV